MTLQIPQILAELEKLDAKRTQGNWTPHVALNGYYNVQSDVPGKSRKIKGISITSGVVNGANNSAFIAAAPEAATALRESVALVEKLVATLEKIAKRPYLPNPERDADWKNCQKLSSHNAREALALAAQYGFEV